MNVFRNCKYLTLGLLLSLFCTQAAFAVTVYRLDPTPVMTTSGNVPFGGFPALYAVANATISLCTDAACTMPATTYTDATGITACPINAPVTLPGTSVCVSAAGPQGQFGFWIQPGTYYYKIITPAGVASGPFPISSPNTFTPLVSTTSYIFYQTASGFFVQRQSDGVTVASHATNPSTALNNFLTGLTNLNNIKLTLTPGVYTFPSTITFPLGASSTNFVLDAEGTAVFGTGANSVFKITGIGDHDTFRFGEINVGTNGTGIQLVAGITQSYITWKALIGTSRTGTGFFADAQNADGGQSSSTSYIIGSDVNGFNRGIAFIADTSFFFDTYQIQLSYVFHNNVGIYVHGLSSPAINNNVYLVNVDCSQTSGDICIETNEQSSYFTFIPSGVNGVGGVGTTQHNVQLDSGAQWNQFNFTATPLALVTNSVVDNSGNTTNRWNATSHTLLSGIQVNCLTSGLTYNSGAQQDNCTTDVVGSAVVGIPAATVASTNANASVITLKPSNSGFSTIDCDKTGSGTSLPCQIQVGGTGLATFGGYTNGVMLSVDNTNSIVGVQGLIIGGLGVSDVTDWAAGQGRVMGIGGVGAANAITNSSQIRMQAFGGGGNVYIGSDATGNGNGQPIAIVMCTGGACSGGLSGGSQIVKMGLQNTSGGGVLIGSSGTVPATGNLTMSRAGTDTLTLTDTTDTVTTIATAQAAGGFIGTTTNNSFSILTNSAAVLTMDTSGNETITGGLTISGITTSNTGDFLCINNVSHAVTQGTTCTLSSERYKHDFEPLDAGLDTVLRIPTYSYVRNDHPEMGRQVGLKAEAVAEIEPRVVLLDRDGKPSTVLYENYTAILTKAIQELAERVEHLEAK